MRPKTIPTSHRRPVTASCIIATFNQEATIGAAIESALNQTSPFDEIIVVDDGSRDATPAIAHSYSQTSAIQVRETSRLGPQGAFNLGIEAASSEVVFLLGGDDVCRPHRAERQLKVLEFTGVDGVFSLPGLIDKDGKSLRDSVRPGLFELPTEDSLLLQLLVRGNFLCGPTAALRVNSLPAEPVFDPNLRYAHDLDLWLRMLLAGATFCVDEDRVVDYRVHHTSLSGNPALRRSVHDEALKVRTSALGRALLLAAAPVPDHTDGAVHAISNMVWSSLGIPQM